METTRRPIKARDTEWAKSIARRLLHLGLKPNQVSILSSVFGCGAGIMFWLSGIRCCAAGVYLSLVAAAIFIQLRLLCNLFDGMLAVEGGLKSKSGELYNELPDRISDLGTLVGAGFGVAYLPYGITLGWIAGSLAVLTAYIRTLGAAAGAPHFFVGPCAKQQRMAIMTAAAVLACVEYYFHASTWTIWVALMLIALGSVVTCFRRLKLIATFLEANAS